MISKIGKLIKHLLRPTVLKQIQLQGVAQPRKCATRDEMEPTVLRILHNNDCDAIFNKLEPIWNMRFSHIIQPEHRVLIKINLNTADSYPASTSTEMLAALLKFLRGRGIKNILVGDCSSISSLPTRKVAQKTGIFDVVKNAGATMVYFDEEEWVRTNISGKYLKNVTVPEKVFQVDRIIALANMKTHCLADFSFGAKLAVGFVHPLERYALHDKWLKEKVAEIQLAIPADMTIIDGRMAFVSGGPDKGRTEQVNTVLLGLDTFAVDVEAFCCLYKVKQQMDCLENFQQDPFLMAQFQHARNIGLCQWTKYNTMDL